MIEPYRDLSAKLLSLPPRFIYSIQFSLYLFDAIFPLLSSFSPSTGDIHSVQLQKCL